MRILEPDIELLGFEGTKKKKKKMKMSFFEPGD